MTLLERSNICLDIGTCPDGTFYVDALNITKTTLMKPPFYCRNCHTDCTTCVGPLNTDCLVCATGLLKHITEVSKPASFCLSDCASGFIINEKDKT